MHFAAVVQPAAYPDGQTGAEQSIQLISGHDLIGRADQLLGLELCHAGDRNLGQLRRYSRSRSILCARDGILRLLRIGNACHRLSADIHELSLGYPTVAAEHELARERSRIGVDARFRRADAEEIRVPTNYKTR